MNILFLTNADIKDCFYGGGKAARSCYELICKIGKTDIKVIKKKTSLSSVISILQGFYPPLTRKEIEKTKKICRQKKYDIVFLNTSIYGAAAKALKKEFPEIPVFVMFQNCELDYNEVRFSGKKSIKSSIYKILVKKSEAMTLKYGDYHAAFSKRDAARLKNLYGAGTDYILPLFLKDEADRQDLEEYAGSDSYCLLFGPNTPPNLEGAEWFAKNVSPCLKIKTVIAGKGMDVLAKEMQHEHVTITGYVEDIHELYKKARCVCLPQFSGGGMKVKMIDALLVGKTVFGTDEAFSGYENDQKEIGFLCNTPDEFIKAINNFVQSEKGSFQKCVRKIYETEYSEQAAYSKMRHVLSKIAENGANGSSRDN